MNTIRDEIYMRRCLDIAKLGSGHVSPNPMVGAVIVHKGRIIGEGYHRAYGKSHAEVMAIESIPKPELRLLSDATIYISLEPCCIHLNTPPCTNLIIEKKIPRVVFASIDKTPEVSGKSIAILESAGIEVKFGVLKAEGDKLAAYRNTYVEKRRPYVILKWAQSKDGFIGCSGQFVWLTNGFSKRLVHKWRSETGAILVGTNTARTDDPELTNRLYFGPTPLRIVLDRDLRLNRALHLYDNSTPTWIVTAHSSGLQSFENTKFIKLRFGEKLIDRLLLKLHESKQNTLLVEGGAKLLGSFLRSGLWDEARVFIADRYLKEGIPAPVPDLSPVSEQMLDNDRLLFYENKI